MQGDPLNNLLTLFGLGRGETVLLKLNFRVTRDVSLY
jgi:hypothetical protein